jgi:hypothetical protein
MATMTAMTMTMKTKATAAAAAAWWQCYSSGSWAAAAQRQWEAWRQCWQHSRGGSSVAAVAAAASLVLIAAWRWWPFWPWRQHGGSNQLGISGSAALAAAAVRQEVQRQHGCSVSGDGSLAEAQWWQRSEGDGSLAVAAWQRQRRRWLPPPPPRCRHAQPW